MRAWLAMLGIVTVVMVACGVGRPPEGAGDPDHLRLDQLSSDAIFTALPPGAQQSQPMKKSLATFRQPAFEPAGWDGPAVSITFTSSQPPESVFSFFASTAVAFGWTAASNKNSLGYPEVWTKSFPGSWRGTLGLLDMSTRTAEAGGAHTYVLGAAGPAIP